MTTLVTGSAGLLGSAFKKVAIGDYYFADRKDADLTSYEETIALFKRIQPRRVIHLAAKVGGVEANKKFPGTFFQENMLIHFICNVTILNKSHAELHLLCWGLPTHSWGLPWGIQCVL